ncbi:MAG TPA: carboxylesterase family protein, partial [Hyphomonadaceae bacterium]|nr:carboxylesterase family protein [Hyphomonadaceae bacterium]
YAAPAYDGRYGVPHGSDVGPSLHEVRGGLNGPNTASLKVADELASAWVAFASTGDPNNKVTPPWAPYTLEKRTTMVFDHVSGAQDDPRGRFREFWAKHPPGA